MSKNLIFCDFGIRIFERLGKYLLVYDAGEIADDWRELEVSELEANEAMVDSKGAHGVIINHHNKGNLGRKIPLGEEI